MLFCSSVFFIFFVIYLATWAIVPRTWRLAVIILGSLFFYGYWNWAYLAIPIVLTITAYLGAQWILKFRSQPRQGMRLGICILILFTPLFIFKYINFFSGKELISMEFPIGISFITFTLLAYLIDVSRQTYSAEQSPFWLLGYVTFFPQLIAGPILRPAELLPQLKKIHSRPLTFRWEAVTIFTLGLTKKLIFADQVKPYVDHAFLVAKNGNGVNWLVDCYLFPMQIYCDFSGYSDMAIGLAFFFGIQLPINFNRPFASETTTELWRRWHITLSYWFRDYVYLPLIKKEKALSWKLFSKFFTITLCGFWHGAGWTFIIWGGFNGLLLCIESLFNRIKGPVFLPKGIKIFLTFHLFAFGGTFFRAHNVSNAMDMIKCAFALKDIQFSDLTGLAYPMALSIIFYVTHPFDNIHLIQKKMVRVNPWLLACVLTVIWLTALCLSATNGGSNKFIYFDF